VSLPRLSRGLARAAVVTTALAAVVTAGAGIASAHVAVSSTDAAAGGFGTVVFTVPNESDAATTTRVRIQIPDNTPLASVSVESVPGWTVTTTATDLKHPLTTDDGEQVTTADSVIDFTAAPGGGIAPGQFQEFRISGGPFPDAKSITFSAVQTYSDGTEVAWIDPTVKGQPEPEHPAPVLSLSGTSSSASGDTGSGQAAADAGSGWSAPVVIALVLSIVALVVALAVALLGRRGARRSVDS
jgi:periplasmic copper chaperone A